MQSGRSARSLGEDNWGIGAGISPTLSVEGGYGVSQDLDVGVLLEYQFGFVASVFTKYSFINRDEGFSLAGYAGAFTGGSFATTRGFYAGPLLSYRRKWFEPYLLMRYTYVHWEAGDLSSDEQQDSFIDLVSWEDTSFNYLQTDLGINFWTSPTFAIVPSAKIFTFFGRNVETDTSVIPGLSFTFLFKE